MSEFLSQDEVDSLLKGVTGEEDEAPAEAEGAAGEVRAYNLASQERIVRGRMPTMEIINERFARVFRIGLFNFIRRTPEISVGPVRVLKFGEFVRNLHVPANLNIVQAPPLRGNGLFIFDPNLVFLVVDNMFGGDGRFHTRVEGREFTQTEQRIILQLLNVVFETYGKSWEPVHPLAFEFVRSEMNPQFANIATPSEVVVVTTFNIELGSGGGDFHICIPYAMIEPIRDILYSSMQGERMEVDHRWAKLMTKQVQSAEVNLVANLGETPVNFGQILNMKVGDVISLDIPEAIVAEVDGVPVLECNYGILNGQYALKVNKIIAGADDESGHGGQHG